MSTEHIWSPGGRYLAYEQRQNPTLDSRIFIFPSEAGTPILGGNLYRQFKAILRKVGVEEKVRHDAGSVSDTLEKTTSLRIHDLRHWACSVMLRDGTPIKEVQEIMGHAAVITTLKIYAHTIGEGKRQAVNRTSRLLRGTTKDEDGN